MTSIEKGTLFIEKKGELFIVDNVIIGKSKGKHVRQVVYYPISDNGLINKTRAFKCNLELLTSGKYKVLDWKF